LEICAVWLVFLSLQCLAQQPKLPVVDEDACPGKNNSVSNWKINTSETLYSTWKDGRSQVGVLRAGERVTVLTGVKIIREPSKVKLVRSVPNLSLKTGDIVFRYETYGDGSMADVWANGKWLKGGALAIQNKDGSGYQGDFDAVVIEDGIEEAWVQTKKVSGQVGWVVSYKFIHGKMEGGFNFGGLCGD
jgi:hypothetical protein